MAEKLESDFHFDMSDWTVLDEDLFENAGKLSEKGDADKLMNSALENSGMTDPAPAGSAENESAIPEKSCTTKDTIDDTKNQDTDMPAPGGISSEVKTNTNSEVNTSASENKIPVNSPAASTSEVTQKLEPPVSSSTITATAAQKSDPSNATKPKATQKPQASKPLTTQKPQQSKSPATQKPQQSKPPATQKPQQSSSSDNTKSPATQKPQQSSSSDNTKLPATLKPQQSSSSDNTKSPATLKPQQSSSSDSTKSPATLKPQQSSSSDNTKSPATQKPQQSSSSDNTKSPATQKSQQSSSSINTKPPATQKPQQSKPLATQKPQQLKSPATQKPQQLKSPATQKPQQPSSSSDTKSPATLKPQQSKQPATQKPQQSKSPATQKPQQSISSSDTKSPAAPKSSLNTKNPEVQGKLAGDTKVTAAAGKKKTIKSKSLASTVQISAVSTSVSATNTANTNTQVKPTAALSNKSASQVNTAVVSVTATVSVPLNTTSPSATSTQPQVAESNKTDSPVKSISAPASSSMSASVTETSAQETAEPLPSNNADKLDAQAANQSASSSNSNVETSGTAELNTCNVTEDLANSIPMQGESTTVTVSPTSSSQSKLTEAKATPSAKVKSTPSSKTNISTSKSVTPTKDIPESLTASTKSPTATKTLKLADRPGMQTKSPTAHMKGKTPPIKKPEVGSIAEIMETVNDKFDDDMEDISDTEFPELAESARISSSRAESARLAGTKREGSSNNEGPDRKKAKIQNVATVPSSTSVVESAGILSKNSVKEQNQPNKSNETVAKKDSKQQNAKSKTEESQLKKANVKQNNVKSEGCLPKKGIKKQNSVTGTTGKGSFGAAKTFGSKSKDQSPSIPLCGKTATIAAAFNAAEADKSTKTTSAKTPAKTQAKRIIRIFHKMTQTLPKQCSNRLVQCCINQTPIEALCKAKTSHVEVQTKELAENVFYQKPLPDAVKPQIFRMVAAFDVNCPSDRNIISGMFEYGISLGHVTVADLEKNMFRENILAKSDHYSLHFSKDFGVVDLFFSGEEQFTGVQTQIRKMKIGPRHLVVTYFKSLKEDDRAPGLFVSSVKATVVYDQNFASTSFLTHSKAPVWNKPKVEETVTIHNLPGGIPLSFIRLMIPDAITIELDDDRQKFTQPKSLAYLGLNRKSGGDPFLKLFAQMYINNECLIFTTFSTRASMASELAEVVGNREKRTKKAKSEFAAKELTAVPRDINVQSNETTDDKENADKTVTQVHDAEISTSQTSVAKGSGSLVKSQKYTGQPKISVSRSNINNDPALSDVSEDLSDISDTSDIGEESSLLKRNEEKGEFQGTKKFSSANSGTQRPQVNRRSDLVTEDERRQEQKFAGESRFPTNRPVDRSRQRSYERKDERRNNDDRSLYSNREKENIRSNRESNEIDETRRDIFSSTSGRGDGRVRRSLSCSRSDRERNRNMDNDRERQRNLDNERHRNLDSDRERHRSVDLATGGSKPGFDRHGNRIIYAGDREEDHGRGQDRLSEQARQDRLDRYDKYSNSRDDGSRKRSRSLERHGRLSRDRERQKRMSRSRSPIRRQKTRGRSASPKRRYSSSRTSANRRRGTPPRSYRTRNRLAKRRRSLSPVRRKRGSALSPISVGDDSDDHGEAMGGMWLSQPPKSSNTGYRQSEQSRSQIQTVASFTLREEIRKNAAKLSSSNLVPVQAEWQPTSHASDRKNVEDSFIRQAPDASSGRQSPSLNIPGAHELVKFLEKAREAFGSGVKFTDSGSGINVGENLRVLSEAARSLKPDEDYERKRSASGECEQPVRPKLPATSWQSRGIPTEEPSQNNNRFGYDVDRGRIDNSTKFTGHQSIDQLYKKESYDETAQLGGIGEYHHQSQPPSMRPPGDTPLYAPARPLPPSERAQVDNYSTMPSANVHGQPPPNPRHEMWNVRPPSFSQPPFPGPPHPGAPRGPPPPMGPQFNRPGPPHFTRPPNFFPPPDVRGPVPHPPQWPRSNFY